MILTNARLILPDGIRDGFEVVAAEGKITAIREQTHPRPKEVIDLHGNYLAPGFVDLHVHGALGRDTMEASTDAFRAICDFHAGGGTTSLSAHHCDCADGQTRRGSKCGSRLSMFN